MACVRYLIKIRNSVFFSLLKHCLLLWLCIFILAIRVLFHSHCKYIILCVCRYQFNFFSIDVLSQQRKHLSVDISHGILSWIEHSIEKLLFAHKQFLHSTSNTPLKCLEGESWNSFGDMFKQELEISFPERQMMIKAFPNARFAFVGKSKHISIEGLSRVPWIKLMLTISKPKFNVQHGQEEGRKNVQKILAKNEIRLNEQRFHFHTFRKRTMWENVRSIVRNVIQLIIIIHSHAVQIDITFAFTDVHTPTIFVYFVWMRWNCDA